MDYREVTQLSIIIRVFAAITVGGLIGLERGAKNRPAGLRTNMLVCVGACLITKAQKTLKRKSGCQATPLMEHEVLYLLNTLVGKPELIDIPDTLPKGNSIVETLQSHLEDLLGMLPVDEALARQKLMETTVAMYEAIDPREYETHRLKRIFVSEEVRTELDGSLLEQTVTAVTMDSLGKVRIRLKNDQLLERRTESQG